MIKFLTFWAIKITDIGGYQRNRDTDSWIKITITIGCTIIIGQFYQVRIVFTTVRFIKTITRYFSNFLDTK